MNKTCPHAASGCNYPEAECPGHCAGKRQPEALWLADQLESTEAGWWVADECCAELRRLHAKNAELRRLYEESVQMRERRDELLEALRKLHHGLDECDMVHDDQRSAYANASAIIAKAEGEKS